MNRFDSPAGHVTFGDMVAIVMRAADEPTSAFIRVAGSIKYLMRQGVLPRDRTGRGKQAFYSKADVMRCLFAIELHSIGLTPIQIIPIVSEHLASFMRTAEAGSDAGLRIRIPSRAGRMISLEVSSAAILDAAELPACLSLAKATGQ